MKKNRLIIAVACACCMPLASSFGDSISPGSFSTTLDVGESVTITKTVTVDEGSPTTSKVDIYFLADQTGSMGGAINNIKDAANAILTAASALGDVQFAVGGYNGEQGDSSFQSHTDLTGNVMDAQNAINAWFASGGGDLPEANLYGLYHAAEDTGWRAGSERILVWFGDAVGHDPSPGGADPSDGKKTEDDATDALVNAGINVQAVSVGFAQLDTSGQATRITDATGGTLYNSINTDDIVDVINDAISTSISSYSTVGLDLSEAPGGVSVSAAPTEHNGMWDRTETRSFDFDVTFTGDAAGTYDFNIYGTVDGGRVATEADRIVVGSGGPAGVPDSGATLALFGAAFMLMIARRFLAKNS